MPTDNPEGENYQPSPEEIKNAEDNMTEKETEMSETREQGVKFRDEIHAVMRNYEVAFDGNKAFTDAIGSFNALGWEYLPGTTKGDNLRTTFLHNLRNNGAMLSHDRSAGEVIKRRDENMPGSFTVDPARKKEVIVLTDLVAGSELLSNGLLPSQLFEQQDMKLLMEKAGVDPESGEARRIKDLIMGINFQANDFGWGSEEENIGIVNHMLSMAQELQEKYNLPVNETYGRVLYDLVTGSPAGYGNIFAGVQGDRVVNMIFASVDDVLAKGRKHYETNGNTEAVEEMNRRRDGIQMAKPLIRCSIDAKAFTQQTAQSLPKAFSGREK